MKNNVYFNIGRPKGFSFFKYKGLCLLCGLAAFIDGVIILASLGFINSSFSLIAERKYLDSIEMYFMKQEKFNDRIQKHQSM